MEKEEMLEMMRQVVEKKKTKSASQGGTKRGPEDRFGSTSLGNKKRKKGGLPPK